jgi:hypothetical protein
MQMAFIVGHKGPQQCTCTSEKGVIENNLLFYMGKGQIRNLRGFILAI